jgi:signal transduction histidine kinase
MGGQEPGSGSGGSLPGTARRSKVSWRWARALLVVAVGLGLAIAVANTVATPMERDVPSVVATAFGAALVPGVLGATVLWLLRTRSVQTQTIVVALVSVAGTAAGVLVASASMFLSAHDRDVLLVVLIAAATVGVLAALWLGQQVGTATRSLAEATRRIGLGKPADVSSGPAPGPAPAPGEFARLARELDDMERRLGDAESARRELVAWVSHDLRTPLAGIRAVAEALEDGVVVEAGEVRRYHRTLRALTDRLAQLVDDLFELSRLQAGAVRLVRAPVALGDLVSDALATVSPTAEAKGVALEGRVAEDDPVLHVGARELGRALQNLLDNAVRHTPGGGRVSVDAEARQDGVVIAVSDTGGGIVEAELEQVFEPGMTGDRARSPDGEGGSGLGLAIAKGFVELHGGRLEAVNLGPGACFRLWLPPSSALLGAEVAP